MGFIATTEAPLLEGNWPVHNQRSCNPAGLDHFTVRDGIEYAGTHLIVDLWGAQYLDNLNRMEDALRQVVTVTGATLLHLHLHHFNPHGGISGVAVLAESHISVHTWPERDYAAFDVFMCGDTRPELAIPVLQKIFHPDRLNINEHLRGVCPEPL